MISCFSMFSAFLGTTFGYEAFLDPSRRAAELVSALRFMRMPNATINVAQYALRGAELTANTVHRRNQTSLPWQGAFRRAPGIAAESWAIVGREATNLGYHADGSWRARLAFTVCSLKSRQPLWAARRVHAGGLAQARSPAQGGVHRRLSLARILSSHAVVDCHAGWQPWGHVWCPIADVAPGRVWA